MVNISNDFESMIEENDIIFNVHNIKVEDEEDFYLVLPSLELVEESQDFQEISDQNDKRKKVECSVCGKKVVKFNMERHMKTHIGIYECDICGGHFSERTKIYRHLKTHRKVNKNKCDQCSQRFQSKAFLDEHVLEKHLKETEFRALKCSKCDKVFNHINVLQTHVLETHTKDGTFSCNKCDFTAKTYHAFFTHKLVHQKSDKEISCSFCPLKFSSIYDFKEHKKKHLIDCGICEEKFYNMKRKMRHIQEKHNSDSLICKICSKTFLYFEAYRLHEKMHLRKEKEKCPYCKEKFAKVYLRKHLQNCRFKILTENK